MIAAEQGRHLLNQTQAEAFAVGDRLTYGPKENTGTVREIRPDSDELVIDFDEGTKDVVIKTGLAQKWLKKIPTAPSSTYKPGDRIRVIKDSSNGSDIGRLGTVQEPWEKALRAGDHLKILLDGDPLFRAILAEWVEPAGEEPVELAPDRDATQATPLPLHRRTFDPYAATYSADKLAENKIPATFNFKGKRWVCVSVSSSNGTDTLTAVEVVKLEQWDGVMVDDAACKEREPFSRAGQVVKCKGADLVLTDRVVWFATPSLALAAAEEKPAATADASEEVEDMTTAASYPVGSRVRLKINLMGEMRIATGVIVPTISQGPNGPVTLTPAHQVSVQYECQLPPIAEVHTYYQASYPEDGIARGTVQTFKKNVELLDPSEQGLKPGLQMVAIDTIVVDPGLQPRVKMDEPAIAEYQEALAAGVWDWKRDPMVGYWDEKDFVLRLSSGWHRYQGAKRAGLTSVGVDVRLGDRSEALLHATTANMSHGVRMTPEDKNRAISLILLDERWQQESDHAIARILCARGFRVDHKKVGQLRKSLTSLGRLPERTERIVRRGGQTYEMQVKPKTETTTLTLEEVKAMFADLGEFNVNGDVARPYKFEGVGVLQRFRSLDEAASRVEWVKECIAKKQQEYSTTCTTCVKRVDGPASEFECTALAQHFSKDSDPGNPQCRFYSRRRWHQTQPAERPPLPIGVRISGYSSKPGEEQQQVEGKIVEQDGDRLRLENGGMVWADTAKVEDSPEQAKARAREMLKTAIAAWVKVTEEIDWPETALESAVGVIEQALTGFEF